MAFCCRHSVLFEEVWPTHKYPEVTFFRNDEAAYQDGTARRKTIKLSKDAEGLRNFTDVTNSCLLAMPHVKGLEIFNDCEENQNYTLICYLLKDAIFFCKDKNSVCEHNAVCDHVRRQCCSQLVF